MPRTSPKMPQTAPAGALPKPQSARRAVGISLLVISLIAFSYGVTNFQRNSIPASYIKSTGTITQIHTTSNRSFTPTILFRAQNGRAYTFKGNVSQAYTSTYQAGESIPIAYNPTNPAKSPKVATVDAQHLRSYGIGVIWFGAVLFVASLLVIRPFPKRGL
jgi:hypothetical protein